MWPQFKNTGDLGRDQGHKKGDASDDYMIIDEAWTMSRELRLSSYSCKDNGSKTTSLLLSVKKTSADWAILYSKMGGKPTKGTCIHRPTMSLFSYTYNSCSPRPANREKSPTESQSTKCFRRGKSHSATSWSNPNRLMVGPNKSQSTKWFRRGKSHSATS